MSKVKLEKLNLRSAEFIDLLCCHGLNAEGLKIVEKEIKTQLKESLGRVRKGIIRNRKKEPFGAFFIDVDVITKLINQELKKYEL